MKFKLMQFFLTSQSVTKLTRDKLNNFVTIWSLEYGATGYFLNL